MECGIDRKLGIGTLEYVSDDKPCVFIQDYGKSYFNMINGKELVLEKDESFQWRGYYKFGRL